MKIEKISETQVKFLITNQDLKEKDITLSEILTQSTTQAREFFMGIMKEAINGLGINIDIEKGPIIMEAMPISDDSVMIIVSKAREGQALGDDMSLIPKTLTERRLKQDGINIIQIEDDIEEIYFIYSFLEINQVIEAVKRINEFDGKSILYKLNDRFYLAVQKTNFFEENLECILSEYGQKHSFTPISISFLKEHGEVIVKKDAVQVLTTI